MKKIILLKSGSSQNGGLEKYTHLLAKGFIDSGCDVTLLTSGCIKNKNTPYDQISLCNRSKISYFHLNKFDEQSDKWIKAHQPDIIFGLDRNRFQTHYRAGNGAHKTYLNRRSTDEGIAKTLSFYINPLHRKILALEKKTYESSGLRRLFTNSHMVKNEILQSYKTEPNKISVIHNGVEWDKLKTPFEESFNECCINHQFLFVGNGYVRKGLAHLLLALSYIKNEQWNLTVIGHEKNPLYYESYAETLGIRHKISFLGMIPSIISYLQKADTLVVPSLYDPFANVTLEALAMGVYVVSSKTNGASEILNAENGSIIPSLDEPLSFAEILKKALCRSKTLESASLIRHSIQQYSLQNQIGKMINETLRS
ncbi:glycosyltransferase family 4 protein [Chlamydiales bacterium]|nr:glycosyltransferase family 4 protein [Chlamydiales bacterium]